MQKPTSPKMLGRCVWYAPKNYHLHFVDSWCLLGGPPEHPLWSPTTTSSSYRGVHLQTSRGTPLWVNSPHRGTSRIPEQLWQLRRCIQEIWILQQPHTQVASPFVNNCMPWYWSSHSIVALWHNLFYFFYQFESSSGWQHWDHFPPKIDLW